jgi:hypothetical protein
MLRSWALLCRAPASARVRPCAFTRLSRASALSYAARPHHCRSGPPLAPPPGPRSAYCSRSGPPSLASARSSACAPASTRAHPACSTCSMDPRWAAPRALRLRSTRRCPLLPEPLAACSSAAASRPLARARAAGHRQPPAATCLIRPRPARLLLRLLCRLEPPCTSGGKREGGEKRDVAARERKRRPNRRGTEGKEGGIDFPKDLYVISENCRDLFVK